MELEPRKKEILCIVVEEYINTGEPVGSKIVAKKLAKTVSSATVRNELVMLEEMGFMQKPHTSAGRVPSQAGFLYYFDFLMPKKKLLESQRKTIDNLFLENNEGMNSSVDSFLKFSADTLSSITNYVSVVSTPKILRKTYSKVDFVKAGNRFISIVFFAGNGNILSELSKTNESVDEKVLARIKEKVNMVLEKVPINELSLVDFHIIPKDFENFKSVLMTVVSMAEKAVGGEILIHGEINIMLHKELAEHLLDVRDILSSNYVKAWLTDTADSNVTVLEKEEESQFQLGMITSKYRDNGDFFGTLGIVGPSRINYSRMIPIIDYFAKVMGEIMDDLLEN